MPNLTSDQLTIAVAAAGALALITLIVALAVAARLRRLRKQYKVLRGGSSEGDMVEVLHNWHQRLDSMNDRVEGLGGLVQDNRARSRAALQKFGLVRFDAFDDMGGRLSFSAAFLDDYGNGLIITSINGRTESRTYAKAVEKLDSEHNLSDEEREAIARARGGTDRLDRATSV